jgi:hypothetical protein
VRRLYVVAHPWLDERFVPPPASGEHQVVVTHGSSLSWVIAAWIGLPIPPCAHASFRSKHTLNDTGHLVG